MGKKRYSLDRACLELEYDEPLLRFIGYSDSQRHTDHKAFVRHSDYLVLRLLTSEKFADKVSLLRHDVHWYSRIVQLFS